MAVMAGMSAAVAARIRGLMVGLFWRISFSANRRPPSDQVRGHASPGYAPRDSAAARGLSRKKSAPGQGPGRSCWMDLAVSRRSAAVAEQTQQEQEHVDEV